MRGYPLHRGEPFRLVVDAGFRDALGHPLRGAAGRRYAVGADERRLVDPGAWVIFRPAGGAHEPLEVTFDRPLDHGLLGRCLHVTRRTASRSPACRARPGGRGG